MTVPDLVLRQARPLILTGAGRALPARDLLIRGGRIAAIGDVSEVAAADARVIDLAGRFVLPGLWDYHTHMRQWAIARDQLDLSGTRSAAEVVTVVAAALACRAGDNTEPLIGKGFRDGLWPDAPTLAALDRIAPDTPIFLTSNDLHCGWFNTVALRMLEAPITDSGVLREEDCYAAQPKIPRPSEEVVDGQIDAAARAAAGRGVVGVVELQQVDNVIEWSRRIAAGTTSLRIEAGVYPELLDDYLARGLHTSVVIPDTDGLLRVGPLKIVSDGSLNTRTAYCHDRYPGLGDDHPHPYGILNVPPDELVPLLRKAAAGGFEAAVHAIGDHANSLALNAFEEVGIQGRIEHAQLLDHGDAARFAELGVAASVQPQHAVDDRDVADLHWAGRTGRSFPYGELLAAGAELLLGSDAPVASLDPWIAIAAASHRSDDDREPWHAEQEIPVAAAIAASTGGRSRLQVGDLADLVIVDLDPLTATPKELRQLPVTATLLNGRFTHDTLGWSEE